MTWLKEIREKTGMTQEAVAEKIELARAAYSNIETGARRPSVDTAKRIAAVLGFRWTRFFEEEGEKQDEGGVA